MHDQESFLEWEYSEWVANWIGPEADESPLTGAAK